MTPEKLVASLPKTIRIGPYDVAIRKFDSAEANITESYGYFLREKETIGIEAEPAGSGPGVADTLLHEIGHAVWWASGIREGDGEERIVATSATVWAQVFRDNPWLLDWLKKALA